MIGLEMEQSSVEMARSNARLNGLEDFARFEVADLYDQGGQNATGHAQLAEVMQENPTSILLDPLEVEQDRIWPRSAKKRVLNGSFMSLATRKRLHPMGLF